MGKCEIGSEGEGQEEEREWYEESESERVRWKWMKHFRACVAYKKKWKNEKKKHKTEITCATVLMWNYYTLTATRNIAVEVCGMEWVKVEKASALIHSEHKMLSNIRLRTDEFCLDVPISFRITVPPFKTFWREWRNYIRIYFAHWEIAISHTYTASENSEWGVLQFCSFSACTHPMEVRRQRWRHTHTHSHAKCMTFVAPSTFAHNVSNYLNSSNKMVP